MLHLLILPLLLLAATPVDIRATPAPPPAQPPVMVSCCLPRVWSAGYLWEDNNATGRLVVDYTQEMFATRESPNGATNWRMQSRGGRFIYYSSTKRTKRDLSYSRPVSAALELNRCLHNGRPDTDRSGRQLVMFELVDNGQILARSACQGLTHRHTSVRLWVEPRTCQPKSLRFYTYSTGRQFTYYLPPPQFTLNNVQGHDNGLDADVLLFFENQPALDAAQRQSNCPPNGSSLFSPIMAAIQEARRRLRNRA